MVERLRFAIWQQLIILICLQAASAYSTIYLEDYCPVSSSHTYNHITLGSQKENSSGILKTSRIFTSLSGRWCTITLQPPLGYGVILSIRHLDFLPFSTGGCQNYIQINDQQKTDILCSYSDDATEYKSYASMGTMDLTLFTQSFVSNSDITFTITAFPLYMYDCNDGWFKCRNSRCIWKGLKCDGHNNCGDQSDEDSSGNANCGALGPGAIVGIVLGCLAVIVLAVLIAVFCYRRAKHRRDEQGKPIVNPSSQSYGSGGHDPSINTNTGKNP